MRARAWWYSKRAPRGEPWFMPPDLRDFVLQRAVHSYRRTLRADLLLRVRDAQPAEGYLESNTLVLTSGKVYTELSVFPSALRYRVYTFLPEDGRNSNSLYEYRIGGTVLEARLLERFSSDRSNAMHEVRNSVVLERPIRDNFKQWPTFDRRSDEMISDLKNDIEWHEIVTSKQKYFLLSKHHESLPVHDFQKYLREEIERLMRGKAKFFDFAATHGFTIVHLEQRLLQVSVPENIPDQRKYQLDELHTRNFGTHAGANFGITEEEFSISDQILPYLLDLLSGLQGAEHASKD